MHPDIDKFNVSQTEEDQKTCSLLADTIDSNLTNAESKIWHRHPVWFIDENPIVGYSRLKAGIRLMFWSGASFDEADLKPGTGKFKDATVFYTSEKQIDIKKLKKWLKKSEIIQWDYKNIYKRKGVLTRLK